MKRKHLIGATNSEVSNKFPLLIDFDLSEEDDLHKNRMGFGAHCQYVENGDANLQWLIKVMYK